jgi:hypothetical protein
MSEEDLHQRLKFVTETLLKLIEQIVDADEDRRIRFGGLLSLLVEKGVIAADELDDHIAQFRGWVAEAKASREQARALIQELERFMQGQEPEQGGEHGR